MKRIPSGISGQQVAKALSKVGFAISRQRGSHIVMHRESPKSRVVVPDHREIRFGTLRQILSDASLTTDQFLDLLDN